MLQLPLMPEAPACASLPLYGPYWQPFLEGRGGIKREHEPARASWQNGRTRPHTILQYLSHPSRHRPCFSTPTDKSGNVIARCYNVNNVVRALERPVLEEDAPGTHGCWLCGVGLRAWCGRTPSVTPASAGTGATHLLARRMERRVPTPTRSVDDWCTF